MVASNILKRIERTVTKDAKAQTVMENIDTLLSTKNCDFCSLLNVDLRDAYLLDVELFGADFRGADFSGATWCNGCICAEGSIGGCNGCAPVDICTGL